MFLLLCLASISRQVVYASASNLHFNNSFKVYFADAFAVK